MYSRSVLRCSIVALVALAGTLAAKPGSAPGTHGNYQAQVAGYYVGEGRAVVSASSVTVTATVVDPSGAKGSFSANNLATQNGRFCGSGTAMGIPVQIVGRVEPPSGSDIKAARVFCTYRISASQSGRIVAIK